MKYKYFYADYGTNKSIPATAASEAELEQIINRMISVLSKPDNFFGIINQHAQTLQFAVGHDDKITIDIPILEKGEYVGSLQKNTSLSACLALVRALPDNADFYQLLPRTSMPSSNKNPWWRFW